MAPPAYPLPNPSESFMPVVIPVAAMLAVLTLSAASSSTVAVLAPTLGPEAGLDPSSIGVFVALTSLTAGFAGVLSGGLIRRFGPIPVLQAGMVLAGGGMATATLATPPALVAAAFLLGLATGPYNPASAEVLFGLTVPRWQPLVFSLKQTGVPLGGMLAGALVPAAALALGWRAGPLGLIVLALGLAVALWPLGRRFRPADAAAEGGRRPPATRPRIAGMLAPVRMVTRDPVLRRLTLTACAYSSSQLAFAAFHVVYLVEVAGRSLVDAGFAFACLQGAGVLGRILWGLLAGNRFRPARLLGALGACTALGLAGVASADSSWSLSSLAMISAVLGLTGMGWNGVMLSEVANRAPAGQAAFATAGLQLVMFLGAVVTPPAFALAVTTTSYAAAYAGLATLAAAGALTAFGIGRQ